MKTLHNIWEALQEVYNTKKYIFITIGVALAFFLFTALINNYRILLSNFSGKLFFSLLRGTISSIAPSSLLLLIALSLLSGIVIAMTIFLVRRQVGGVVGAGSLGIFAGLVAPACPSCAIGVLSLLGFGGFLSVLPWKGLELGVVGVLLLGGSLVYLSNKITTKTCTIAEPHQKDKRGDISLKKMPSKLVSRYFNK